jgi:uncharacterized membrane protein YtjA (UPF0391 family)
VTAVPEASRDDPVPGVIPVFAPPALADVTVAPSAPVLQFGSGRFLYWALVLFVLAIVAAVLGFRSVAGISMEIARILVLIFLALAVLALLL